MCSIVSIRKRGRKNKEQEGRNGGTKEEGGRETEGQKSLHRFSPTGIMCLRDMSSLLFFLSEPIKTCAF